ncbi:MAG: AbrB/MazE/SpoVT family DNA-binding domain-containing protein [Deltaproteobacteria bacterium]
MSLVKVKKFAQVTIPANIRQKAHIEEGDYMDVRYEGNMILMIPKRVTDKAADWGKRFDDALGTVSTAAKKAGITEGDIKTAVKSVRKRARH